MSEFLERISKLSPKRLALLALELQEKVEALEAYKKSAAAASEPTLAPAASAGVAIIGLACRFPGEANTPDEFWQLLREGRDAITEIDPARWDVAAFFDPDPDAPGKVASRWGGFLKDVDKFDPHFFGIAPREAMTMDPQQRLALELAWEALENAGYAPDKLANSLTGVFMGLCNGDYGHMQMSGDRHTLNMYSATGNAHSVVSGRISYVLGLQGPAVSVDTACSSSAVAVHLAVQSLRNRECNMALAGGVNLILSPDTTIALSRAKMMAPDGRCKAFDAAADGFVRSEGGGLVVLKRFSEAMADGDNILAVIRGSAINQDGRSNGLTAPNGPAQEAVIRAALANASVKPEDVSYIETHGTGTSLGDPIEVRALGAVYGKNRSTPFAIGSVKTNLGHAEAAAGIAGLIKVVLALQHGELAPHLHLKQLSPYIAWNEIPVTIPTSLTPWQPIDGRRIAGVSSFGFSGTNAHLIVEQSPEVPTLVGAPDRPLHILTLSAKSDQALRELALRYARHLAGDLNTPLPNICLTANAARAHFNHRLSVIAQEMPEVIATLEAIAQGQPPEGVLMGQASRAPEVVFMFTGQGAQYVDMGRRLYETQPTFRKAIDRCDEILRPYLAQPLLSVLYPSPNTQDSIPDLNDTAYTQPALFAIEYALAELWRSWGIVPSAVIGHSVGEYVAACVAGVFSLEDGLKLIAERARLMASLPPTGEMAAVFATEARVVEAIAPRSASERVSIAAINWQDSVVISGETGAVQSALDVLREQGIKSRKLAVSIASHSPLMEPILDEFERAAATVKYSPPQIEFISGMTGQPVQMTDASYWRRHVRQPVRFADCIQTLYQKGYRVFVEVGPAPTLLGMAQRCVTGSDMTWVPSLRPGHEDWKQMLTSLGTLYVHGADVDWAGFDKDYAHRRVPLPTYPFQRERYWLETVSSDQPSVISHAQPRADAGERHPLLGRRVSSPALPADQAVFESQVGATRPPFLDHHRIFGMTVMPSPAYIEMALAGAAEAFGAAHSAIADLTVHTALLLPAESLQTVQLILNPSREGLAEFRVFSLQDGGEWTLHATGKVQLGAASPPPAVFSIDEVRARCPDEMEGALYYQRLRALGLEFGSSFRGITRLWRREGEALGQIDLPAPLVAEAGAYRFHPAFLDACFHLLGAPLPDDGSQSTYLLIGMDRFVLHAQPGARVWNHTVLRDLSQEVFTGDIRLYDESGQLVAEALGLQLKRATRQALERITRKQRHSDWLYEVQWQPGENQRQPLDFAPRQIAEQVLPHVKSLNDQHSLSVYQDLLPELDKLTAAYVRQALHQLGWKPQPKRSMSAEALAAELGIVPQHHRLLGRLLQILDEDEIRVQEHDPQAHLSALMARFGSTCEAEITLTGRCGQQLADVLRGQADPLQLLFPDGSFALAEKLYQDSPFARTYNGLAQQAIQSALARLSEGRKLHVLEIGAGTGGTTSYLLPILPAGRTEYVFTDVSPLFIARAQEKLHDHAFVRYQLLDIEREPSAQGFAPHSFDVIVAANVLHATADLRQTLKHVQQLLAPEGLLVLLEGTTRQRWVDITFGLLEGWWKFRDADLRPDYPLLAQDGWVSLLTSLGFADAVALPEGEAQTLVLARGPGELPARDWLILSDASGLGQELAALIAARGGNCQLLSPAAGLLPSVNIGTGDYGNIVYLCGLDAAPADQTTLASLERDTTFSCSSILCLVQAMLERNLNARLWLVTRNANALANRYPIELAHSPLWGLGRVIALEQPELWGGLIDLDPASSLKENAAALLAEIQNPDSQDQIAFRDGKRFVARLVPMSNAHVLRPMSNAQFHPNAAYLVTGGLGGLGLKVAQWLAEQGARHIVLTGRNGLSGDTERKTTAIQAIEALGATVTVAAADVSDREQMVALLGRFGRDLPPLRGLVHAAADMSAWPVKTMTQDALAAMLRPKVAGTWILHELTREMPLDFFVLFSSTTALWGSRDLAHYAAANTFLDAFALYRRSLGLPALAINWGIWDEMRTASAKAQAMYQQFGLRPMRSDQALEMMGNLLGADLAQITIASVDWSALKPAYEAKRARPFLSLVGATAPATRPVPIKTMEPTRPELLRQIEAARPGDRRDVIAANVRGHVARVLGLDPSRAIDDQQGLFEMGMDSLMSVELKSRLETGVGHALPSTLTFNYPSVAALTDFLLADLNAASAPPPAAQTAAPALERVSASPAAEQDDLSEDELADMLAVKLSQLR